MKCNNCNYTVSNEAVFCPNCGSKITEAKKTTSKTKVEKEEKVEVKQEVVQNNSDVGSAIAWGLLGFFIPLVGLILFIVWKNDKPGDAKGAGIGALIRVGLTVLLVLAIFAFAFIGYWVYS